MTYRASVIVVASPDAIIEILRDLDMLAEWNPALGRLRETGRAVAGRTYHTRIRGVVPARVEYLAIESGRVDYRMTATGAEEIGSWVLGIEPAGRTRVTHSFAHSGLLLSLMAPAFADVALRRVTRLAAELSVRASTGGLAGA